MLGGGGGGRGQPSVCSPDQGVEQFSSAQEENFPQSGEFGQKACLLHDQVVQVAGHSLSDTIHELSEIRDDESFLVSQLHQLLVKLGLSLPQNSSLM